VRCLSPEKYDVNLGLFVSLPFHPYRLHYMRKTCILWSQVHIIVHKQRTFNFFSYSIYFIFSFLIQNSLKQCWYSQMNAGFLYGEALKCIRTNKNDNDRLVVRCCKDLLRIIFSFTANPRVQTNLNSYEFKFSATSRPVVHHKAETVEIWFSLIIDVNWILNILTKCVLKVSLYHGIRSEKQTCIEYLY
jgi:hypothetical protein